MQIFLEKYYPCMLFKIIFGRKKNMIYLQSLFRAISSSRPDSYRELSGGSEHPDLPVGRVGGSLIIFRAISSVGSEHMPYKHRVGGSTPSSPTPVDLRKPPQVNCVFGPRLTPGSLFGSLFGSLCVA